MAAKHARHDMREDKNFKGTDPSETTAQYLYCGLYRECQADLCKDVKMFILQTYANEEKRSQDMYWKWITRYLGTGHCL